MGEFEELDWSLERGNKMALSKGELWLDFQEANSNEGKRHATCVMLTCNQLL